MLYHWYELGHDAVRPARVAAGSCSLFLNNPFNPLAHMPVARHAAAACEVFERTTRRYTKPKFNIDQTLIGGKAVSVCEDVIWSRPFCRLLRFCRGVPQKQQTQDPKVLLIAPMSGHYATLLRGTVEALLPDHDVYIIDWQDARNVPYSAGTFDLDVYIDYLLEIFAYFEGDVHVFAVCQPAVPVLAAVSLLEEENSRDAPQSLVLAGGPVDTRINPTAVNELAEQRGTNWFARNVITTVPWPNLGYGRSVYPGFLQLTGFMAMNPDRHWEAHSELFLNLVRGDGDSAEKHRDFYDEYLAVMDLCADFYLQTIDTVFVRHALPRGEMTHRGRGIKTQSIRRVAMMTIEGEKDDITGVGQCVAAHDIVPNIPDSKRDHYACPGVGHYGIFNGSRFRSHIAPRIGRFIRQHDRRFESLSSLALARTDDFDTRFKTSSLSDEKLSSLAFSFAPANDTSKYQDEPKGYCHNQSGSVVNAACSMHSFATVPFQWWALAGNMLLDGLCGLNRPRCNRDTTRDSN